jgi:hypothetical protein
LAKIVAAVSICTHCGQDHDAKGGVCTAAAQPPPNSLQISNKTMFGVPPAPVPLSPKPAAKPVAATLLAPASVRLPPPPRPALPTAEEARQNPNLVISLDVTPVPGRPGADAAGSPPPGRATPPAAQTTPGRPIPSTPLSAPGSRAVPMARLSAPGSRATLVGAAAPHPPSPAPALAASRTPAVAPETALELDRSPAPDTVMDLPNAGPPVDLPPAAPATAAAADPDAPPIDLPKPGSGPRMALPAAPMAAAAGGTAGPASRSFAERLAADLKSVINLLGWATTFYLRRPQPLFVLAALMVLPASLLESCVVAGITAPTTTVSLSATTVDFSARKADLARRIQESQSRGQIDGQAVAELAALTTAETAHVPALGLEVKRGAGWFRAHLALFVQGLLILGLAFPVACGLIALALIDGEGGGATPGFGDVWPILVSRAELFLVSLVPAALLVAVGNFLFVLPGLALAVLFLFLPHVVLFEKRGGRAALLRSIELTRGDAIRTVLTFASFALAGAVVALLTELLLPTTGSRALAFLHFIAADAIAAAVLPIPALVLGRLYLDLRGGSGNAERLSRAARG